MQLKAMKTFCTAEYGSGLGDGGFKILGAAGLDLDLGDFGDHERVSPSGLGFYHAARP